MLDAVFDLPAEFPTGRLEDYRDWPMETADGRPIAFDELADQPGLAGRGGVQPDPNFGPESTAAA